MTISTVRRRFRRAPGEKRQRITEAARRCFSLQGYDATTTAEIAQRAQVSEGTVFHHFGSKQDLLAAVAAEYARGLALALFDDPDPAPTSRIEALMRRGIEYIREQGVVALAPAMGAGGRAEEIIHREIRDEVISRGTAVFEAWQRQGVVRPMNARIVAELLYTLLEAVLRLCAFSGDLTETEEYLAEAVRCAEGAIAPTHTQGVRPSFLMDGI